MREKVAIIPHRLVMNSGCIHVFPRVNFPAVEKAQKDALRASETYKSSFMATLQAKFKNEMENKKLCTRGNKFQHSGAGGGKIRTRKKIIRKLMLILELPNRKTVKDELK